VIVWPGRRRLKNIGKHSLVALSKIKPLIVSDMDSSISSTYIRHISAYFNSLNVDPLTKKNAIRLLKIKKVRCSLKSAKVLNRISNRDINQL